MQSNQGHRSIYSCIIGLGRKRTRPLQTSGNRSNASYYSRIGDKRNAIKNQVTDHRTLNKVQLQATCDGQLLFKRKPSKFTSARFVSSSSLISSVNSRSIFDHSASQDSKGRSFSTVAPILGRPCFQQLQASECRSLLTFCSPQSYSNCKSHKGMKYRQGLVDVGRNARAVSSTAVKCFGAPGKGGGGGGGGGGGSTGNFRTHSYQFMNTSRNIFGTSEGETMFDLHDIDYHLFDYLSDEQGKLAISKFLQALRSTGLRESDPRLKEAMTNLTNVQNEVSDLDAVQNVFIDRETFRECIADNIILIAKAFRNQFIIPEFTRFTNRIDEIFWRAKANTKGKLASYIPQLARYNPESWGLAVCTVDGQRYSLGDALDPICIQSMSKPLTYAMVLDELGPDVVHQYVGQEPSGQAFNTISLDYKNRPHNPMVNSGAVIMCALLKQGMNIADKFDYNQQKLKQLCGNEHISFNNAVFLSERQSADRNYALGYYMKENQCFPKGTNLHEILDFYFQLCSVELNCESGAVIAATLANGGICPTTGFKVLEPYCIRDTLSLMLSCGMYDYSGQFAFKVGLPGKSGVSGGIMLVVPNVMGIFMWSPPLDHYGNSVRGIQFCEDLVRSFNFHNYDNLRHTPRKNDPRVQTVDQQANMVVNLIFSAYNGDVTAIRRCALLGMDMSHTDYDGRTALHVAAAEGHYPVVQFLLEKCNVSPFLVDRWGFTPLDDAKRFQHSKTTELLHNFMEKQKAKGNAPSSYSSGEIIA